MSANNQLIIKRRSKDSNKWDIYMDYCVDNEMNESDLKMENALKTETSLIKAIKWCNNYMQKEIVEYGYVIWGIG